MADFKLGIAGSEVDLPACVADELATEAEEAVEEEEMADHTFNYNFKENVRQTYPIEWTDLTAAEATVLDGLDALKQELNYINGYMGITGAAVVIASWSGRILIVDTSGLTTPRYRGTMVLKGF